MSRGARELDEPGAYVQIVYSTPADPDPVLQTAADLGWRSRPVARKRALFESFLIYRFELIPDDPGL